MELVFITLCRKLFGWGSVEETWKDAGDKKPTCPEYLNFYHFCIEINKQINVSMFVSHVLSKMGKVRKRRYCHGNECFHIEHKNPIFLSCCLLPIFCIYRQIYIFFSYLKHIVFIFGEMSTLYFIFMSCIFQYLVRDVLIHAHCMIWCLMHS